MRCYPLLNSLRCAPLPQFLLLSVRSTASVRARKNPTPIDLDVNVVAIEGNNVQRNAAESLVIVQTGSAVEQTVHNRLLHRPHRGEFSHALHNIFVIECNNQTSPENWRRAHRAHGAW